MINHKTLATQFRCYTCIFRPALPVLKITVDSYIRIDCFNNRLTSLVYFNTYKYQDDKILALTTLNYFIQTMVIKGFFQFEIITNVLIFTLEYLCCESTAIINIYFFQELLQVAITHIGSHYVPLDMKGCICHMVEWQIHSFISKATNLGDKKKILWGVSWKINIWAHYVKSKTRCSCVHNSLDISLDKRHTKCIIYNIFVCFLNTFRFATVAVYEGSTNHRSPLNDLNYSTRDLMSDDLYDTLIL